mmetsp:Transcript_24469/g.73432  ORF Transcript_24469/g.73432 Transcript_24469/m.73432 type:complete len:435 (+) Transcript_24469:178-1482(+)
MTGRRPQINFKRTAESATRLKKLLAKSFFLGRLRSILVDVECEPQTPAMGARSLLFLLLRCTLSLRPTGLGAGPLRSALRRPHPVDTARHIAARRAPPRGRRRRDLCTAAASLPGEAEEVPKPAPALPTAQTKELALADAYKRCGEITKIFSKTFYFGTTFFSEEKKKAVWAIYVWCRRTDDIVDSPLAAMLGPERMEADLDEWKQRLDKCWAQDPTDTLDLALSDAKKRYPDLDIQPYYDMIDGMLMDTPGHGLFQDRYATWDELYTYCYRVAGTVGLMVLPVLGAAKGYTMADATPPGLALGIAFQITNILRDVGEDALRGRIYLPKEDMDRFGVSEKQILDGIVDDNYRDLMKFEIERAEAYYREAETGIPMLAPEARLAIASSLRVYRGILRRLEENDYDNFRKRAYTTKLEKFLYLPEAWVSIKDLPQE